MSDKNDPEYYATRKHQERDLAASANDLSIKAINLDMAERYAKLKAEAARKRPQ